MAQRGDERAFSLILRAYETPVFNYVLRMLAEGLTDKEIAAALVISPRTVETHVSSVLRKTQLSNRYELSRWASDRRLV